MRKIAAGKTAKAIDTAPSSEATGPVKTAKPAAPAKAKKALGESRVAKSASQAEPPRISLAALAAMDTTPKAAKARKTAPPAKAAEVVKVAKIAKTSKTPKVARKTEVAATPIVADITDATTDPNAANGKRTLRGIKLAWNLDAAATDASQALSAPVASETLETPAPVPLPPRQLKPTLKARPTTAGTTSKSVPQLSFFASVRAYFRNPPGVTLAGLAGLVVALAFFAATQDGMTSDDSVAPAMAATNDAPVLHGPSDYPPAVYPPYPGADYGAHSNYREGRLRH